MAPDGAFSEVVKEPGGAAVPLVATFREKFAARTCFLRYAFAIGRTDGSIPRPCQIPDINTLLIRSWIRIRCKEFRDRDIERSASRPETALRVIKDAFMTAGGAGWAPLRRGSGPFRY